MATENLTVEHDPQAGTASFNLRDRVLTLPVWKDLPDDTLDMLIGHEVSHALYTPAGEAPLLNACKSIDPKNPDRAQVYINVVEDARIERLIKRDYPGLRRSFVAGYDELLKRDLFRLKDKNVAELGLLDRINLQYKVGHRISVPFSAAELPLVQRLATTLSWEDVVALSKEIYDFVKESKKSQPKPKKSQESQDGEAVPTNEKSDDEEQSDGEDRNAPGTDENGDDEADSNGKDTNPDSNTAKSPEDESEDGESPEGEQGQGDVNADPGNKNSNEEAEGGSGTTAGESGDDEEDFTPDDAETVNAMGNGLQQFADRKSVPAVYAELPTELDGFVVPVKTTLKSFRAVYSRVRIHAPNAPVLRGPQAAYEGWKNANGNAVQVLATEFDRRKAADEHKRTLTAETGVIDPNRLHSYRITDDIFLRNAVVKDGKNHGLVLLLDMSGSIHESFHNLVCQLVTLAHFCRRVNIPFRFYGFTDRAGTDLDARAGDHNGPAYFKPSKNFGGEQIRTRLVTLLEDGMKNQEFMEQCGYLLLASYCISHYNDSNDGHPTYDALLKSVDGARSNLPYGGIPDWFNLDQTPLNAALLGARILVNEFRKEKRVQVVNLVVLTDGEASDSLIGNNCMSKAWQDATNRYRQATGSWGSAQVVWRDPVTRKEYSMSRKGYNGSTTNISRDQETETLIGIIRSYGVNVLCMYATAKKSTAKSEAHSAVNRTDAYKNEKAYEKRQAMLEAVDKRLKDDGWVNFPGAYGYTDYIVFPVTVATPDATLDAVDASTAGGLRSLRNQFVKNQANRRGNRPLLSRIAEVFSK
jgi:cobalamin biosynthesis protein CobT